MIKNICHFIVYNLFTLFKGLIFLWIFIQTIIIVNTYDSGGCGTAFFINDKGDLVTAAHVVGSHSTVFVDGYSEYADVIARDRINDIAILKSPIINKSYLSFNAAFTCGRIDIWGYPEPDVFGDNIKDTIGKGHVGHYWITGTTKVNFDSVAYPGNSGSPILDQSNRIVGMVTMGYRWFGNGFGPTANQIIQLANENNIPISLVIQPTFVVDPPQDRIVWICVR